MHDCSEMNYSSKHLDFVLFIKKCHDAQPKGFKRLFLGSTCPKTLRGALNLMGGRESVFTCYLAVELHPLTVASASQSRITTVIRAGSCPTTLWWPSWCGSMWLFITTEARVMIRSLWKVSLNKVVLPSDTHTHTHTSSAPSHSYITLQVLFKASYRSRVSDKMPPALK